MAFDSAKNIKVTRSLSAEKRETVDTVLAGSWKDAVVQVDDGRECDSILLEDAKGSPRNSA